MYSKLRTTIICVVIFAIFCYMLVLYNINTYIGNDPSNIHFDLDSVPDDTMHSTAPQTKTVDLLIIMIDNRHMLLNKDNHHSINFTYLHESYFYYSFCINFLYANHHNYALLLIDPLTNDSKHACYPLHYHNKHDSVPMEWCKLEILSFYLKHYTDIEYKWLMYIDADAHIIKFNTSFYEWLHYIEVQYAHYINNIQDIHFLLTNDTPRFIERELPRLQNAMKPVTKHTHYCNTYANAGVLFLRRSAISLSIIDDWMNAINKIPTRMIREFPREQGALNCFVSHKYAAYTRLLPAFTEINIDWFYRDFSFVQHITSANQHWRTKRFASFLSQLIESNKGNYTKQCEQKNIVQCLPSFKNVFLKWIHVDDDVHDVLLKCVRMEHEINQRSYGNMRFMEHVFR